MFAVGALFAPIEIDNTTARWTFGAHEPYMMYRRVGRRCTGGIDGNAKWLKPWMDWFDSESPALMEELGFNWLHCRFYKGLGWETEKGDFPNVRRFVANCRGHGVHALAYVQFSTFYPETMRREIADLESWAQVGEDGRQLIYHDGSYFRWLPCITNREWLEYLKKVCSIALEEGGFDGIMFDNAFTRPCYCERCERLFHEHLAKIADPAERFGFESLEFVRLPRPTPQALKGEIRDPVVQEWCRWRQRLLVDVFAELRAHIKGVKADAVICANPQPFRNSGASVSVSMNIYRFARNMDILLMQSDNFPEVTKDGQIRNRVRDLKIASEVGKPIVALCDSDAKITEERERHYLLPLMEDLIWGGIPTDRTIISPKPVPGFVDKGMIERRRPLLAAFNAFARSHRTALKSPSHLPVRLLWTPDTIGFSERAHLGLAAAEEVFLRNKVPFGYVISTQERPLDVPSDCGVLVVPDQVCLSDSQVSAIVAYAKRGGTLVVTGDSGRYDEWNSQRLENPLLPQLENLSNVVVRTEADRLPFASLGWLYRVAAPKDGGAALMSDIVKCGYRPPFRLRNAPACVFAELKRTAGGFALFLLNYNPDVPVDGALIEVPGADEIKFETMLDDVASNVSVKPSSEGSFRLPAFARGALVTW